MGLFGKKETIHTSPTRSGMGSGMGHNGHTGHSGHTSHTSRTSRTTHAGHTGHSPKQGGFFSRGRSSSLSSSDYESSERRSSGKLSRSRGGGMFSRGPPEDPTIIAARERLAGAEHAERQADRAVMEARTAVSEAREHMKRLELEAKEDARLAKIKQHTAKDLGKRSKPLGRY